MGRTRFEGFFARRRNGRCIAIAAISGLVASAAWVGLGAKPFANRSATTATSGSTSGPHRAILAGQTWINTRPLRPEDLRGKVVLVNFWTYSCINSLRPLPYLRAWSTKYRDRGLVVIGVHAPEFEFEKDLGNVRRASLEQGVDFPVVLDSDHRIWRAYGNQAWPAFYFLGTDGTVRRRTLGEGGYEASERLLQTLLSEATATEVADPIIPVTGAGAQAAPDWNSLGSGETYIGYDRATGFVSHEAMARDRARVYRAPAQLPLNGWSLSGHWNAGPEFATLEQSGGRIAFRFLARDLHLVMGPPADGRAIRFRVRLDGEAPGPSHGVDVDAAGWGTITSPRMYQLVRQRRALSSRTFEIEFQDAGARAYVFTFG